MKNKRKNIRTAVLPVLVMISISCSSGGGGGGDALRVDSVTPDRGTARGGEEVAIKGCGCDEGTRVV
ncbi:MAG: hypothetical protein ABIJ56_05635, partial [Pseudomonadota bacterium]